MKKSKTFPTRKNLCRLQEASGTKNGRREPITRSRQGGGGGGGKNFSPGPSPSEQEYAEKDKNKKNAPAAGSTKTAKRNARAQKKKKVGGKAVPPPGEWEIDKIAISRKT